MAKGFNFNKVQRRYYPVTLKDGKTYLVAMPEKRTFEKLQSLDTSDDADVMQELRKCVAEIISNNKQGKRVKPKEFIDYSLDEIMQFIHGYVDFIKGLENEKN